MPNARFKVRVTKDSLVFSSGHFITFDGDHCERIHGHNYRVAVEVEGPLDENSYVFDFLALRDQAQAIVNDLDHRMLLPSKSRLILLEDDGPNVMARYKDRRWSFPREECVILPVANTTAEALADVVAAKLRDGWTLAGIGLPGVLRVEVEESFGQAGEVEWRRDGSE